MGIVIVKRPFSAREKFVQFLRSGLSTNKCNFYSCIFSSQVSCTSLLLCLEGYLFSVQRYKRGVSLMHFLAVLLVHRAFADCGTVSLSAVSWVVGKVIVGWK